MQVTIQGLFPPANNGAAVVVDTNAEAKVQTLISQFCTQKGMAFSGKYGVFDEAKNPLRLYSTLRSAGVVNGQNLYIGYMGGANSIERRWPLYVAIAALIIGMIGILSMSLSYGLSGGLLITETALKYGVVVDAGSTKTKPILYEWPNPKYKGTGCVRQVDSCKVSVGMHKAVNINETIGKIIQCTENITRDVPKEKYPETPLYFAATAGMRLLRLSDANKAASILAQLETGLPETGLDVKSVSIITGMAEGIYGWTTANFLMNTLDAENTVPWTPVTYGALDLGGASTQVSFAVPPQTSEDSNIYVMQLYGETHHVFSDSYLCFGRDESERRQQALLVKSPNTRVINDPCRPKGNAINQTGAFLFAQPCTQSKQFNEWVKNDPKILGYNFTFNGIGNYAACQKNIADMMDTQSCKKNEFKECFYPLARVFEDQKFLAFANFFYTTSFLNATNGSLADYESAVKKYCTTTFKPTGKDDHYRAQYCYNAIYIHYVLLTGYGFNSTTWNNIEFIGEIEGKEISWSLGLMINATNMIPSEKPLKTGKSMATWVLVLCLIIFLIIVIATLLFIINTLRKQRSGHVMGLA